MRAERFELGTDAPELAAELRALAPQPEDVRRVVAEVVRLVSRGRLLTVVLPRTRKGRHRLRRGAYRVAVAPGRSRTDYGVTSRRTVRLR